MQIAKTLLIMTIIAFARSASSTSCVDVLPLECNGDGCSIDWPPYSASCENYVNPTGCCEIESRTGACTCNGVSKGTVYEQYVIWSVGGTCGAGQCVPFTPPN